MNSAELDRIVSATAYDRTGDRLGKVGQIYLDDSTNEPTFLAVNTGLFGMSESLVPLSGHRWDGDKLLLAFEKDVIKDAPNVDVDQHISEQEQDDLFTYYGGLQGGVNRRTGDAGADGDAGAGVRGDAGADGDAGANFRGDAGADAGADGDAAAVTRSEERLNVGKQSQETGRVRLRKYTTTEEQSVTVPVTKEKVVVEREPIEGGGRVGGRIDADADEQVQEIVTREEVPVVDKETVEVEKVRVGKEAVTENETVSGDIRKEHIEVDGQGDVEDRRRR